LLSSKAKAAWRRILWVEHGFCFFGLLCELCDYAFDVLFFGADYRLTEIHYMDGDRAEFTSHGPTPAALGCGYGLND